MIKKGKHTVQWTYVIVILTVKKFLELLTKKNCKRKNQIKFKIGILITRKGNKLYVKWEDYNNHCVKSIRTQSFFWSVFSCIWTEYGKILRISPYSVQMLENTDQRKLPIWTFLPAVNSTNS